LVLEFCNSHWQFPERLIPLMIAQLLAGKPLLYGDGRNVRDWLYVQDHCLGIEAVLERGRVGEVYNIGGRSECENIHLVHRLCAIVDELLHSSPALRERFPNSAAARGEVSQRLVRFVTDRPGHDRRYAIDCSRIERECGFRPRIALEEGLRATVAWYLRRADVLSSGWQRTVAK
jgi:dTDP-glucose 4,6-dehydratase